MVPRLASAPTAAKRSSPRSFTPWSSSVRPTVATRTSTTSSVLADALLLLGCSSCPSDRRHLRAAADASDADPADRPHVGLLLRPQARGRVAAARVRARLPRAPAEFAFVGERLQAFIGPVWSALADARPFSDSWPASGPLDSPRDGPAGAGGSFVSGMMKEGRLPRLQAVRGLQGPRREVAGGDSGALGCAAP